jgi:hypothetical protein
MGATIEALRGFRLAAHHQRNQILLSFFHPNRGENDKTYKEGGIFYSLFYFFKNSVTIILLYY